MPDKISLLRVLFSRKELSVWTEEVKSTMKCIVYRNPANFYETFVEILFTQTTERSPLLKKGYQERSKMHVTGEKMNSNKDLTEDFLTFLPREKPFVR